MVALLAQISFCGQPNNPICNPLKWDRGSCSEYAGKKLKTLVLDIKAFFHYKHISEHMKIYIPLKGYSMTFSVLFLPSQ